MSSTCAGGETVVSTGQSERGHGGGGARAGGLRLYCIVYCTETYLFTRLESQAWFKQCF